MAADKGHDSWRLPWTGSCRCGRVTLRITKPPLLTGVCHCTGCRKMSASAFSLSIAVPGDAFSVSGLEPEIGGLHGKERHHFCPWCKSWMFTRVEYMDGFVNVRASMLDEHHWVVLYAWQKPQAGRRPSGSRRRVTPLRRATRNPFGPFRRTGAST